VNERDLHKDSILETYCFFKTDLSPRANAYLLTALINSKNLELLKNPLFRDQVEQLSLRLSKQLAMRSLSTSTAPFVHLLRMDSRFLDFLRLSGGAAKATEGEATSMKLFVDRELAQFRDGFS
jgi:hypothetical protein